MQRTGIHPTEKPPQRIDKSYVYVCYTCKNPIINHQNSTCMQCAGKISLVKGEEFFGLPKYTFIRTLFKHLDKMENIREELLIDILPKDEWTIASLRHNYPKEIMITISLKNSGHSKKLVFPGKELINFSEGAKRIASTICENILKNIESK